MKVSNLLYEGYLFHPNCTVYIIIINEKINVAFSRRTARTHC